MSRIQRVLGGFRALFYKRSDESELDEELRCYLDLATRDNAQSGMNDKAAHRVARVRVGSIEALKDEVRDVGWESALESLGQDVRYALRTLRKAPGFTLVSVLTLALGIGANTAIFSAAYSILLKPLEYRDSGRLVLLWGSSPAAQRLTMSVPEVVAISKRVQSFEGIAFGENQTLWLAGNGLSGSLNAGRVSGNFFELLGIRPAIGRWITPDDAQEHSGPVVVLSDSVWEKRFGADPNILGKTLLLADSEAHKTDYQVIGVMPRQFASSGSGWLKHEIYFPLVPTPGEKLAFNAHSKLAIGRMKTGVSLDQVNTELKTIGAAIANDHPGTNKDWNLHAEPMQDFIVKSGRVPLLILTASVALLFLIACLNVSNLVLYRGWTRARELFIRRALGASRVRVIRQLLVESLVLALFGGVLGVLLASWGVGVLRAIAPASTPRLEQLHFDPIVLLYAFGASLLASMIFGVAPAWQVSSRDVDAGLKRSGVASPGAIRARSPHRLRAALIVTEFAMTVVLLTGSVLLIRSFLKLTSVPVGFRADHVLTMWVNLEPGRCDRDHSCLPVYEGMLARVRALPGIKDAALASFIAQSGMKSNFYLNTVEGHGTNQGTWPPTESMNVSPGYFDSLGVRLARGRAFTDQDSAGSTQVAIVNAAFAHQYFGESAIGKHFALGVDKKWQPQWIEIVGQVDDIRDVHRWETPGPEFFRPIAQVQYPPPSIGLVVRTEIDPSAAAGMVRSRISEVDKFADVSLPETLAEVMRRDMADPRFRTQFTSAFSLLAVLLAAVGIYGVLAFTVTQRTHDMGVRIALGARASDIAGLVVREGFLLSVAGIVIGVAISAGLTRYLQSLLFDVTPLDPATFGVVTVFLVAVALLASVLPARRATRVDPLAALRAE